MALQSADIKLRKRVVVFLIECDVLAVLESASSEQHRHIAIIVGAGVAEIRRQQHIGLIEKAATTFVGFLESSDESAPGLNQFGFDKR